MIGFKLVWTTWFALCCQAYGPGAFPEFGEDPCPAACESLEAGSASWTTYSTPERLKRCNQTILLEFAVYTPLSDDSKAHTIKACTSPPSTSGQTKGDSVSTLDQPTDDQTESSIEVARWISELQFDVTEAIPALERIQDWLSAAPSTSVLFVINGKASLGIWAGAFAKTSLLDQQLIKQFRKQLEEDNSISNIVMQACGGDISADYSFGIAAAFDETGLEFVQNAVKSWTTSTCLTGADEKVMLSRGLYSSVPKVKKAVRPSGSLHRRAACRTIRVASGDTCTKLASRCGVSLANLQKYNPGSSFCSSIQPEQPICCSAGDLPKPVPSADGTCATYTVQSGDWCAKIAASHAITLANLEAYNKNTWGWLGCENLQANLRMCVSTGSPPMPAPVSNAQCGPTKPGTTKPNSGTKLADLNPCPLKSCCNFWGQCGTTADFCTKPGNGVTLTKGCISNCGTEIIKSAAPAQFKRIAYFEGFNTKRKCLKMDVSQISESKYTHIHFAFIGLTTSYQIETSETEQQWNRFKDLKTSMKKIVSFGGWTFSAEAPNYDIFRQGMKVANRETLANNIANFVKNNNLDGVDIDWEYPSAPDLPGIPAGAPEDATNYLAFLKLLRTKLPTGKSLSIAAPASFWYLKPFPIEEMAKVLDYIVFMTYDLHGQWDYGNEWASPGCPKGNCLRSHVNMTETDNALSMITKAGVPSNKILVGVSSYGRSFKMTDPSCTGPMCTYTAPESGATKGICTDTAGYISNAEISLIIQNGAPGLKQFSDNSDSDILVYGNNWVAYMSEKRKEARINRYKSMNFGGISDWAVDLQQFWPSSGEGNENGSEYPYSAVDPLLQGCTDPEGAHVLQAWREAGEIAYLHWQWSPKGKWQNAMDRYLGTGTRNDYDFWGDPGPVGTNIFKEYMIHFSGYLQPPHQTYAYWYCHEKDVPNYNPAKPECGDNTTAYTWDDHGWLWSAHYVVLCPTWWDFNRTKSLRDVEYEADGNINYQLNMTKWKPVRARVALHETYHWEHTVSEPRCRDLAYKPQAVIDLAKNKGTGEARKNAESFAQAGLAIFIMDTWGHSEPPSSGTASTTNQADDLTEKVLDAPPAGWVRPVSLDSPTFKPNADLGAVSLSEYGVTHPYPKTRCYHGDTYWSMAQCSIYCPNKCTKAKNSDGQDVFKCDCKFRTPSDCHNGAYPYIFECEQSCAGGKCTRQKGMKDVVCSGCPAPLPCKNGSYKNWDECSDNCDQGLCTESAGVTGITCKCS